MSSWNQIFDEAFDNYVKCAPLIVPKDKKESNNKQKEEQKKEHMEYYPIREFFLFWSK